MNFVDVLELFERDPATHGVILVGEIGGSDEEAAARYIHRFVSKPVVAYVAGVTAPPGKRMGHAGAIVAGGKGTAADKYAAFTAAGVRTVKSPAELGSAMAELLRGSGSARGRTLRPAARAQPARPRRPAKRPRPAKRAGPRKRPRPASARGRDRRR
jgi:succinyl-CoA synthetase alpha subunit